MSALIVVRQVTGYHLYTCCNFTYFSFLAFRHCLAHNKFLVWNTQTNSLVAIVKENKKKDKVHKMRAEKLVIQVSFEFKDSCDHVEERKVFL